MASTTRTIRRIIGRTLKFTAPWLEIRQTYNTGEKVSTLYHVEPVPCERGRRFRLDRLDGERNLTYIVSLYANGSASCQHADGTVCPSFGYSRQECKHVAAVRKCCSLDARVPAKADDWI